MPELPEVETIARQLKKVLVGQKIVGIEVLRDKSFGGSKKAVIGKKIVGVERRAKMLLIETRDKKQVTSNKKQVTSKSIYLLVHLKMTGQLVYDQETLNPTPVGGQAKSNFQEKRVVGGPARNRYAQRVAGGHPTEDWVKKLPSKHTRVVLELSKGKLYFNDMRVFGWIKT